jgi:hypothetical protein
MHFGVCNWSWIFISIFDGSIHQMEFSVFLFRPAPECFVAVRHMKDGLFYRAVVRTVNPNESSALVQFLDFGNEGIVKFQDLFPLDQKDLDTCAQALKCFVSWTSKDWMSRVIPTGNLDSLSHILTGRGSAAVEIKVLEFWKSGEVNPDGLEEPFSEDFAVIDVRIPDGIPYELARSSSSLFELSTDNSSHLDRPDQTVNSGRRQPMDH